jgi:energy-coupling factor transporter ATP-binding protein EcfA2
MKEPEPPGAGSPGRTAEKMISLSGLNFRYAPDGPRVLKEIRLQIGAGERVLVAGRNGAGKTTLSKVLSGLIPHVEKGLVEGECTFQGRAFKDIPYRELVKDIAILFQDFEAQIVSSSVGEEMVFYALNIGAPYGQARQEAERVLSAFGLAGLERRAVHELSGGEKQKIALLSLLTIDPSWLILDEPFTDIEPASRESILDALGRLSFRGGLVLFDQELTYHGAFDRLVVLHDGRVLYDGDPRPAVGDKDLLERAGLEAPGVLRVFSAGATVESVRAQYAFDEKTYARLAQAEPAREKLIEVRNLSFAYEGSEAPVLDRVSFEVGRGDFVAVVGPNGSGKTTLMKLLAGILRFDEGDILYQGTSIRRRDLAGIVGYVYQNPDNQIFAATVAEEIGFILKMKKTEKSAIDERTRRIMDVMGLADKREADPFTLSKGDREKLACASILVAEPEIIILDEPTTGLDFPSLQELMALIERLNGQGRTVLMITHAMEVAAAYGRTIMALEGGRILFYGEKRAFFANGDLLDRARVKRTELMDLSLRLNGRLLLGAGEFRACWTKR